MIVLDDIIADMASNKKLNPIVTELITGGWKLNIFLVFITQYCFAVPKNIRLNYIHCLFMKTTNNQELLKIAFNHSSFIDVQDSVNL